MEQNKQIKNYSKVLDQKYGAEGTPERIAFEEEAYAYYTGQLLEEARKNAHLTQSELARRIGADKSYISRIEKGKTEPKVSTFYRIVHALGLSVELNPTVSED
jgi:DNA-binding XRE family transcriptional regulator